MIDFLPFKVSAPAKVNLTLEVLGRRDDGYHDLRSVVATTSLADTLEFLPSPELRVETIGESALVDLSHLGTDPTANLAYRAARLLAEVAGVEPGVRIAIVKRIPLGGGLGGGSADAAATLVALNDAWRLGFSREKLAELGAKAGSDVPALVWGGVTLMEGRGERVAPLPVPGRVPLNLVLARPPNAFASTARVFSACTIPLREGGEILYNIRHAISSGDPAAVARSLHNDLTEAAFGLLPELAAAARVLRDAGALGVSMSGSGATLFGVAASRSEADRIASVAASAGLQTRSVLTCPVM